VQNFAAYRCSNSCVIGGHPHWTTVVLSAGITDDRQYHCIICSLHRDG
jgi:hypothetical protein